MLSRNVDKQLFSAFPNFLKLFLKYKVQNLIVFSEGLVFNNLLNNDFP